MFLDRLPPSLQQYLLLEWLSPESVWILVRVSGAARRCVLKDVPSSSAFRATEDEVLSDACVRWFHERGVPLRLWTSSRRFRERPFWYLVERHFTNGKLHRDGDLPAIVREDWMHQWYQHGRLHRDGDKPAVWSRGFREEWYQHGKLHRDGDKPAVVSANGTRSWYQNGRLHRDNDEPAVTWANGTQVWYRHGERHREDDRPAEIRANGTRFWFQYDKLHRTRDAPAIIAENGSRWWFLNGKLVGTEQEEWTWQPSPHPVPISNWRLCE